MNWVINELKLQSASCDLYSEGYKHIVTSDASSNVKINLQTSIYTCNRASSTVWEEGLVDV